MNRGKTGLLVLIGLASMFFLFVAILYGSSTKRQDAIDRKAELDAKLGVITESDITIYWIGEPPKELEPLAPVIKVIEPSSASKDNLPIKGPSFHTTEYTPDGRLLSEDIPIEYPENMVIVISGSPVITENGASALLDSVAKNGVPVIAVGDGASEVLGNVLSYKRTHKGQGTSLYYCLGKRYKENILPKEAVTAGGYDLADAIADFIPVAMEDYTPVN